MQRAAILIGVARTGNLPHLRSVERGISEVKCWLDKQPGFGDGERQKRIVTFIDTDKPVNARSIKRAVTAFTSLGTIDQLFIYFAGHGVNLRFSEYWLLSEAPEDPNEAVNLRSSIELARYSGIRHVVFVSDACRTAANSIEVHAVSGTVVFPNPGADIEPGYVDTFYATMVGRPSFEIRNTSNTGIYEAIYTQELVRGLSGDAAETIYQDEAHPRSTTYVRAWSLKEFLARAVPKRIVELGKETEVTQKPDAIIQSDPRMWLAEVPLETRHIRIPNDCFMGSRQIDFHRLPPPKSWKRSTSENILRRIANESIDLASYTVPIDWFGLQVEDSLDALFGSSPSSPEPVGQTAQPHALQLFAQDVNFIREVGARISASPPLVPIDMDCGFITYGTSVVEAFSASATSIELRASGTAVYVNRSNGRATNVLIVFDDGRGALLPAIEGFIGLITYDSDLHELLNVDYEAADELKYNPPGYFVLKRRPRDYRKYNRARRRSLAAAIAFGVLPLAQENSMSLRHDMRRLKGRDPTMALYAAHALHQTIYQSTILEIAREQQLELGLQLFDIALLSRLPTERSTHSLSSVFPPIPILSRAWSLLDGPKIDLLGPIRTTTIRPHVTDSVWTLLDPEGVTILRECVESGEIK